MMQNKPLNIIKKKILLGSSNQSKIALYKDILSDQGVEITTPEIENVSIQLEEDLFDIVGNSIKKAGMYAEASGLATISDDTGIFIPALDNQPGVAVRRWGGELPDDISDEDWEQFFIKKISSLGNNQLDCYKHQVICLALPNNDFKHVEIKTEGLVIKRDPKQTYHRGGPFSAYFFLKQFNKVEAALTTEEKDLHTQELKSRVVGLITCMRVPGSML